MQVEKYKRDYKDVSISLLNYKNDPSFVRNKGKIWEWQYDENPFRNGTTGIVINNDGMIAGYSGFMPVEIYYNRIHIPAVWCVDAAISPDCRGKGYGSKLIEESRSISTVVMGLGISDVQARLMRKRNYLVNQEIEQYYFTNRANGASDLFKKAIQYAVRLKNIFSTYAPEGLDVETIPAISASRDEIDVLWESVKGGYTKIVKRNYAYIHWKYAGHPINNYSMITVRDKGSLVGVGIFRYSDMVSRLVDYIGPADNAAVKQLIISEFMKRCSGARLFECITTDHEFKAVLGQFGFRKYRARPKFYIYSDYADDVDCHENWFIMGGDSDADMNYWN